MVDVVEAISTSIDMVKKLRELNKKVGEAEFKMLLADLTSELGDAKLEAGNLKMELAAERLRTSKLTAQLEARESEQPEIEEGAYIFGGDPSRHYCTGCFDTGGRKIMLTQNTPPFDVFGRWKCPACKQTIGPGSG